MVLDGSNGSVVEGNTITSTTKRIAPAIRWLFTLNNYTETQFGSIVSLFNTKAKLYVIGDEVGESGTPHLQGYVEFKSKCRPIGLFEFKPHWEKCKGSRDENIAYCSKEKIKISFNIPKPIKIITDLYVWQKDIEKLYHGEPDDRKIYWFWEKEGNKGKSAFIKYMVVKYNCLFCSGGKHTDIMNLVFNQDMRTCRCVIFDIPRANKGHISYASLESIKNGLVCNTKYETGFTVFNSPHLFIFANFPPDDEDMLSNDRWVINEL